MGKLFQLSEGDFEIGVPSLKYWQEAVRMQFLSDADSLKLFNCGQNVSMWSLSATPTGNGNEVVAVGRFSLTNYKVFKKSDLCGFRPICSSPVLKGVENRTTISMLSVLVDGKPVPAARTWPPSYEPLKDPGEISFTDTYYGKEFLIPWVVYDGIAMATHSVLSDITYNILAAQGFVPAE